VARAEPPGPAKLPESGHSFLHLAGPALLSAYYLQGDAAYLRFYEHEGQGGEVTLALDWAPSGVQVVDLLDRPLDVPLRVEGRQVRVQAQPWQIVTLRLDRA
jgi:alpha-mannosidase